MKLVDENTIGVVGVLGSTFDGSYEPIAEIAAALDRLQERTGLNVPIHVDGASGGMVAPFLDTNLEWDFRIARAAGCCPNSSARQNRSRRRSRSRSDTDSG